MCNLSHVENWIFHGYSTSHFVSFIDRKRRLFTQNCRFYAIKSVRSSAFVSFAHRVNARTFWGRCFPRIERTNLQAAAHFRESYQPLGKNTVCITSTTSYPHGIERSRYSRVSPTPSNGMINISFNFKWEQLARRFSEGLHPFRAATPEPEVGKIPNDEQGTPLDGVGRKMVLKETTRRMGE